MPNSTPPKEPEPALARPVKKSRLEIAREKAAQANALLQKLEAQARARESGQERKLDTRRKVLLGAYLLTRIQKDPEMKVQVLAGLDKYLGRDAERALFALPPLPKSEPVPEPAEEVLQEKPPAEPAPTAPTQTSRV
jgi:hypothetical protein